MRESNRRAEPTHWKFENLAGITAGLGKHNSHEIQASLAVGPGTELKETCMNSPWSTIHNNIGKLTPRAKAVKGLENICPTVTALL